LRRRPARRSGPAGGGRGHAGAGRTAKLSDSMTGVQRDRMTECGAARYNRRTHDN